MAKLGIEIHVVEALLNHQSGVISGIKAVYIKHNYNEEAKKAVEQYEIHLREIVSG